MRLCFDVFIGGCDGHDLPALATPPGKLQWVATYYRKVGDISIHNRSGLNKGETPDGKTGGDGAVCPDLGPMPDQRRANPRNVGVVRADMPGLGKNRAGAAVDRVFQNDPAVELGIVHYPHVVSQEYPGGDSHVAPDMAVIADNGMGHDMTEMQNGGMLTDVAGVVHIRRFVDVGRFGPVILEERFKMVVELGHAFLIRLSL